MAYFKNDEYLEAKKQLKEEYAVCYQKAATYIHAANYGLEHEENCMMQLLDDFLSAQNEGKPISKITGPDLRKFCDIIMKSELNRITNRKVFITLQITGLLLCVLLIIFFSNFVFKKKAFTIENFNQITFGENEIFFFVLLAVGFALRKLISIVFFNHAKLSAISGTITFLLCYGASTIFIDRMEGFQGISIPIPLPVFLFLTVLSIAVFIACIVIDRKNKIMPIIIDDNTVDHIEQVVCPECKKEHDCDYPRCPYCKHRYSNNPQDICLRKGE